MMIELEKIERFGQGRTTAYVLKDKQAIGRNLTNWLLFRSERPIKRPIPFRLIPALF
jgi:hypothetical protein